MFLQGSKKISHYISSSAVTINVIELDKRYCGGHKHDLIPQMSEALPHNWNQCVQYTKQHHMNLVRAR